MRTSPLRVIVADDHPVVRFALTLALERAEDIKVVGEAHNSTDLIPLLQTQPCDVLLLDFCMPNGLHGDGIRLLLRLRKRRPSLRIVVHTSLDYGSIFQSIQRVGVRGIVSKLDDLEHLPLAIRSVGKGGEYVSPRVTSLISLEAQGVRMLPELSEREERVLKLYSRGFSVSQISGLLHRSKQTISLQKCSGMNKLGFTSEFEFIAFLRAVFREDSASGPAREPTLPG